MFFKTLPPGRIFFFPSSRASPESGTTPGQPGRRVRRPPGTSPAAFPRTGPGRVPSQLFRPWYPAQWGAPRPLGERSPPGGRSGAARRQRRAPGAAAGTPGRASPGWYRLSPAASHRLQQRLANLSWLRGAGARARALSPAAPAHRGISFCRGALIGVTPKITKAPPGQLWITSYSPSPPK